MPRHGGDVGVGDGAWIVDGDSRDHDRQHPSTAKEHARITWHKFPRRKAADQISARTGRAASARRDGGDGPSCPP